MFEFDQYLGFLAFAAILTIGFWLMIFSNGVCDSLLDYWNDVGKEKMKKEAKKLEAEKAIKL